MPAFATTTDVELRLGRELTTAEEDQVELLTAAATAVITQEAGKTEAWADDLDPVPRVLRYLTVELVLRAMANPQGVVSFTEQLGAYSTSQRFRDTGGGLLLTKQEGILVRQAVYGETTGSARLGSILKSDPTT